MTIRSSTSRTTTRATVGAPPARRSARTTAGELDLHDPVVWEAWLARYQCGIRDGINRGRAQANQEWTDVTSFACRTALEATGGVLAEELQQRRRESQEQRRRVAGPPLTPQQIRDRAAASWAHFDTAT